MQSPQINYDIIPPSVKDWTPGRVSTDYIILHTTDCSEQSADATFHSGARQASAHRIVGEDGTILVEVSDGDTAWGAANWYVNQRCFNLEVEDKGNPNDATRTPQTYSAAAWQVADWCRRYNIPCVKVGVDGNHNPTGRGIALHYEVSLTGTACPDGLDYNRIISEAQAILGGGNPSPVAVPPTVTLPGGATPLNQSIEVTADTLYVRDAPSTAAAIDSANTPGGQLHSGAVFTAIGWVHGEMVGEGVTTDVWLISVWGHYVWAGGTNFNYAPYTTQATPEPAPAPEPQPSATPDYEASYVDSPIPARVMETASVAIDATGQGSDKPLPAGTVIDQAGTFNHNGHDYVRTAYGKAHGTWYGIPAEAFNPPATAAAQPQTPAPTPAVPSSPGKSVDGLQPAATPQPTVNPASEPTSAPLNTKLSPGQWLTLLVARIVGTLVTDLKVVFGRQK